MIAVEINEDDYRIACSTAEFVGPGEWGPLPCGCCLVATEIDPVGPRLLFFMQLKSAERHEHSVTDFPVPL